MQNFRALGAPPPAPLPSAAEGFAPKPPPSGGWGFRPQTPIGFRRLRATSPGPQISPLPIRISGYAPGRYSERFSMQFAFFLEVY